MILVYLNFSQCRMIGRTSTYYAIAPFIGVVLSCLIFRELPSKTFVIALIIMMLGAYLASADTLKNSDS